MRRWGGLLVVLVLGMGGAKDALCQVTGARASERTVDELVNHALANNPELQAARSGLEAAQGRLLQAGLRPNPMLDVGWQRSVTGPDNNFMAGVTLPLDLNGRRAGRVGVAESERGVKAAQLAERERVLRAEVRLKAGEVLSARRNLEITAELLEANHKALSLLHSRVRRGALPPLEENLLRVEVNRLEAGRQLLESRLEVLGVELKALAGLEPEAPLALRGELRAGPMLRARDEGLSQALATRPDVLAARAEVEMAAAKVRKEHAEGRWDASVNVGYLRQDFGYDLRGLTERGEARPISDIFHYVGGGVTVTLPVRNRNQGNIRAALAEAQAASRRLDAVALMTRREVVAAFIRYEAAKRALETYETGVRGLARENLSVVRRAYELGRHPLLDVIAEQRRYIDVEMGYTEVLKHAYEAGVEVERALGPAQ